MGLVPFVVEVVALGADALGERHQLRHALVAVVLFAVAEPKLPKSGSVPQFGLIDHLHHRRQPLAVGRQAAVVLDDDVDIVLGAELGEPAQARRRPASSARRRCRCRWALTRIEWQPRNLAASTHL